MISRLVTASEVSDLLIRSEFGAVDVHINSHADRLEHELLIWVILEETFPVAELLWRNLR